MTAGPMDCTSAIDKAVECARRRAEPGAALNAHLRACEPCRERWEVERGLSEQLCMLRIGASARRSPAARQDALMRQFAARHRGVSQNRWLWSVASAAVLLVAFVLVGDVARRDLVRKAPVAAGAETADDGAEAQSAELQTDGQYEGFIAVPYVPPLAPGELVSVVHTELYPAALASLGVSVDPAWTTGLPADLLIGEDGFPRAVRVSADDSDDTSF